MKRITGLLLALLVALTSVSVAMAQAIPLTGEDGDPPWVTVTLPEGVIAYSLEDTDKPVPSDDLEPMYHWMELGAEIGETTFYRMPFGRVLASVCSAELGVSMSAAQLLELWPDIARGLSEGASYLNNDPSCASVETWNGREWLMIRTTLVLDGPKMISLELLGYAACEEDVMREIWMVTPTQATYLYDDAAMAELTADREAAQKWLDGLSFLQTGYGAPPNPQESTPLPLTPATDETDTPPETPAPVETPAPEVAATLPPLSEEPPSDVLATYSLPGRFSLSMPENTLVITSYEAQTLDLSGLEDSHSRIPLFRYWLDQAMLFDATLFVAPGYQTALLLMSSETESARTLEDLEALAPQVEAFFAEDMPGECTLSEPRRLQLGGVENIAFIFEGRYQEVAASVLVTASLSDGIIREANLWSRPDDSAPEWLAAMGRMLDSVRYDTEAE